MAVSPLDVLVPAGRIDPAIIWPGLAADKVQDKIGAFITDGAARSTQAEDPDESTKLWVYYRAKDEQYQRMVGTPASATDSDEGSRQYTDRQIQLVREERDALFAEYDDSLVEEEGEDEYGVIQSLR